MPSIALGIADMADIIENIMLVISSGVISFVIDSMISGSLMAFAHWLSYRSGHSERFLDPLGVVCA